MNILVTGAAGFIGSHLCRRLLADGHRRHRRRLFHGLLPPLDEGAQPRAAARQIPGFKFIDKDLNALALAGAPAGQSRPSITWPPRPGVRASWGRELLGLYPEQHRGHPDGCSRPPRAFRWPEIRLRFLLLGLRADPDSAHDRNEPPPSPLALRRHQAGRRTALLSLPSRTTASRPSRSAFLRSTVPASVPTWPSTSSSRPSSKAGPSHVYGDGRQTRDFTFVDDIVEAYLAALTRGTRTARSITSAAATGKRLDDLFPVLEEICGRPVESAGADTQKGDVAHTFADIDKARQGPRLLSPDRSRGRPGAGMGLDPTALCAPRSPRRAADEGTIP